MFIGTSPLSRIAFPSNNNNWQPLEFKTESSIFPTVNSLI